MAVVLSGWVLASALAFFIVAWTTFFGIALIGLAICYVSTRFELDANSPLDSRDLTVEQRMSVRHEQSLSIQSARFFKHLGLGLTLIGLCGGLYYQL
jgi:hypothetical protein